MELLSQWVKSVKSVSSTLNSTQIAGPNRKYPQYGVFQDCWSPASSQGTKEHIELIFDKRVFPKNINIYETSNPGALVKISVKNDQKWIVIYEGKPTLGIQVSRIFSPLLTKIEFRVNEIRLDFDTVDSAGWIGIDAVQLVGTTDQPSFDQDLVKRQQKHLSSLWLSQMNVLEQSDVTILCGKERDPFYAWKFLLEIQSEYFRGLFNVKMKESERSCIVFEEIESDLFAHVLRFLYSGTIADIEWSLSDLIQLLKLGDYFTIPEFQQLVLLKIGDQCFDFLLSDEFLSLSPFCIIFLIKSENFLIPDEDLLFKRTVEWAKHNYGEMEQKDLQDVLSEPLQYLRYGLLQKNIVALEQSGVFPTAQPVKTYKSYIPGVAHYPRKLNDSIFKYSSDFDENGVLFYIGLADKKNRGSWTNPHHSGKVRVFCTGQSFINGEIMSFVGRNASNLWLSANSVSSFCIDMRSWVVHVTHYTMRHFDQNCCYPKKWNFEGSDDGERWITISSHEDPANEHFSTKGASKTFAVESPKSFQYFRLINLTENSSNWNFGVSGFELYGSLHPMKKSASTAPSDPTKRKILRGIKKKKEDSIEESQ